MMRRSSFLSIMAILRRLVTLGNTVVSWEHRPHVPAYNQEWSLPVCVDHVFAWCADFTTCLLVSLSPRHRWSKQVVMGCYLTVWGLPGLKWQAVTTQWNAQIPSTIEGDLWRSGLFAKRAMVLSLVNCHPPCCSVAKGDVGVTSPGAGQGI